MRDNRHVTNPDRLTGLDASFLALEEGGAHMHVGSVLLFEGDSPAYEDLLAHVERRLALVPRYRQKLAFPPLVQSRPVWIDDPHFNAGYHVRHTALPEPAGEHELRRLAGRLFAQRLDRSKPLWELWLVDRVGERPLRADLQDAPLPRRRDLRRRHRDRAVRPRRRPARAARAGAVGAAAGADVGRAARRRARRAGGDAVRARARAPRAR